MANSNTYIRDGFVSAGSAQITGSLGVTGGITGSLQGTASYATQALSASYAPSAGGAAFPFTGSAIITGSLNVIGNTTITGSFNASGSLYVSASRVFVGTTTTTGYTPPGSGMTIVGPNQSNTAYGNLEILSNTTGADNGGSIILGGMQFGPIMYPLAKIVSGYVGSSYGGYLSFCTELVSSTLTEKMRITSTGLVGIGTTTPTAVLHLKAGAAAASSAPFKFTSGTNLTTPEAGAVEFDGNSLFFTTGSTRSTILTNINPAGITGSIRIAQTGSGTNGSNLTFIGTEGVVIGKGKVPTLENIFIGSGSINTSITTGTQNYCFGVGSGNGITSGIYNVLMGPNAGASINSGQSNVFIGRTTGYRTTTGLNNIALGNTTLYYNTTTSDNIAIGTSALQGSNANTGARNIGIGSEAGYAILTGNNNVYVGYRAGRFISDGVTDALVVSASIFIGAETRPLSSSQTNQIVIGHEAIGLGSNTVVIGNNSITTTALKGNTQVSGSLSVSGSTTIRGNTTITGSLYNSSFAFISSGLVVGSELGGYVQSGNHKSQIIATSTQTPLMIQGGSGAVEIWKDTTPSRAVSFGMAVPGGSITNDFIFSAYQSSWAEIMRITSAGSVGIGTTTPNAKLDVNGNAVITGSLLLSGSSLVAGITPIPLAGTIQDGITSVLGSLNDWDSDYYQGTVLYSETAGATITFGQLCYRTNAETWALADATAIASSATHMLGICVKSSTATNPTSILINGFVEATNYATILKSGEPLYMATTAGSMTKTAPTTAGNIVRLIGHTFWDSNSQGMIVIRFNPENSWIEL